MTAPSPDSTPAVAASPAARRLHALLPAVHRLRDAERDGALRELTRVLAVPLEVVEESLEQFYDDLFIETCAQWVTPYLGDLVGYRALHGEVPTLRSPRAEVANTIALRRRKGTAAMVEQLAGDVTGWPARVVEFFERLVTTQYVNHVRPHAPATPDLRDPLVLTWTTRHAGAFDDLAHTADVRRAGAAPPLRAGRYNIPHLGVFLWRTEAVRLYRSPLVAHGGDRTRFRFDPLGCDAPLFGPPRPQRDITRLAEPWDVPLPLDRRWLRSQLGRYYGAGRGLLLESPHPSGSGRRFTAVPVDAIEVHDLSDLPDGDWAHRPARGRVAVDPVLGRVRFGTPLRSRETPVATYHYGAALPVGARGSARGEADPPRPERTVAGGGRLQPVLEELATGGTLRITDSGRFRESPTVRTAAAPAGAPPTAVWLRASDRTRPTLVAGSGLRLAMAPETTVVLDGLLLTGGPVVIEESLERGVREVLLRDCTLVPGERRTPDGRPLHPGRAGLLVLDPFARVRLERCVLGPVVAVDGAQVSLTDCVVDASDPTGVAYCGRAAPGGRRRRARGPAAREVGDGTVAGGRVELRTCTVVGGVHTVELHASDSLFVAGLAPGDPRPAAVWARRRQQGCVRFCYLPDGSRTGPRYHCVPGAAASEAERRAVRPRFTSLRFGDPGYAQLAADTPQEVRLGAQDESEMGASHLLHAPQRERNLALRLEEYLRFGLEAGVCYAT